jgi:hypothetical protein
MGHSLDLLRCTNSNAMNARCPYFQLMRIKSKNHGAAHNTNYIVSKYLIFSRTKKACKAKPDADLEGVST